MRRASSFAVAHRGAVAAAAGPALLRAARFARAGLDRSRDYKNAALAVLVEKIQAHLAMLCRNLTPGALDFRAVSTLLNANTIRKQRLGLREYMAAKMTLDCTWMLVGDKVEARCVAPLEPEFEDIVHEGYQEDFGKTVSKVTGDMRRLQAEARARQNLAGPSKNFILQPS